MDVIFNHCVDIIEVLDYRNTCLKLKSSYQEIQEHGQEIKDFCKLTLKKSMIIKIVVVPMSYVSGQVKYSCTVENRQKPKVKQEL